MRLRWLAPLLLTTGLAAQQLTPQQKTENLQSFELVWSTVRDRNPDRKFNDLDWQAVHDTTRPLVENARSADEFRGIIREMLGKLNASHYAVIPADRYEPSEPAPPEAAGTEPQGKLVTFGNLPAQRIFFEARQLPGGAGYIRFNEFLDPVSIMPQFEAAVKRFSAAPGIVLDLRGNPGGIGIMAMGIAGFFVGEQGQKLGEMKMPEATLKFVIFPRPHPYKGALAILVDGRSASTTEILAQGLQDLGRARIFGTRTAGAALPSDIVRLPNGDRFQFAQASYTSAKGRVLEGNGVTPDETVQPAADGHDAVIEAAQAWIGITAKRKSDR